MGSMPFRPFAAALALTGAAGGIRCTAFGQPAALPKLARDVDGKQVVAATLPPLGKK